MTQSQIIEYKGNIHNPHVAQDCSGESDQKDYKKGSLGNGRSLHASLVSLQRAF